MQKGTGPAPRHRHTARDGEAGRSLTEKKEKETVFRYQFSQKSRALHVLNHGWWRLAVGGWRRLAVGSWQLAVGGGWRLAVGGSWRLAVGGPLGRSLRAVLNKKKTGPLRTALRRRRGMASVEPKAQGPKPAAGDAGPAAGDAGPAAGDGRLGRRGRRQRTRDGAGGGASTAGEVRPPAPVPVPRTSVDGGYPTTAGPFGSSLPRGGGGFNWSVG